MPLMCVFCCSLRVNAVLEGGLRLSQLSALSLLEMSSSESLGVENGELLSTSSYRRLRLRDEPASMETRCLRAQSRATVSIRVHKCEPNDDDDDDDEVDFRWKFALERADIAV